MQYIFLTSDSTLYDLEISYSELRVHDMHVNKVPHDTYSPGAEVIFKGKEECETIRFLIVQ